MTPHLISLMVMIPLIALILWRRVRSQFGRQKIRRKRMLVRVAIFSAIGVLIALGGLRNVELLEGLVGGVLMGAALGLIGLRLTRFDRADDGTDGYIPNVWIGALLTGLLVGRLLWRVLVVMPQLQQAEAGAHAFPAIGSSPLTMLMIGLLVGYYVAYFSGLLIHHRRFERAQSPSLPPSLSTH